MRLKTQNSKSIDKSIEMSEKDLQDISKRDDFKELSSKGGKGGPNTNQKKSNSKKLWWLKKKNPETLAIMDLFKSDNPEDAISYFISEVLEQKELTEKIENPKDKIRLRELFLNRFQNLLKLKYGDKLKENINEEEGLKFKDFMEKLRRRSEAREEKNKLKS